ncbi:MAG TPA: VTT domain-containing protein [Thermomicrobiaceae bacterium]|nr:VTT domain-containing protein [Thermomicrobiaceae bacterium]
MLGHGRRTGARGSIAVVESEAPIQSLILQYGLIIVVAMVFVGELGVPTGIPVEVALFLAGAFVLHSPAGLLVGLACVMAADLLGASSLYLAVRAGGGRLLSAILRGKEEKALAVLRRWRIRLGGRDIAAVCAGRLLPVARMYVTIASALARISLPRFLLGSLPASAFWSGIPLILGYLFRSDATSIAVRATRYFNLIVIAVVVGVIVLAFVWWLRRGGSIRVWLHQSRCVVGVGVAAASIVYLIATSRDVIIATSRHLFLPTSLVELWMAILTVFCLALMALAALDLRSVLQRERRLQASEILTTDLVTTVLWSALVLAACAIMLGLEFRYPAL